ncbi:MAG: gamma-glutamyl-gamma-aminobutyrate hydrolase family protein [Firmicutes bacterium]|nr:gamma-glutamyl-gamma-aminobutyrate hydrolase family protein [Bacillota bacterium]
MKRNRRFTWLLSFLVVIVMTVFMSACGGSGSGDESEDAQIVAVGISWQEDIDQEEHGEDLMAYVHTVEKAGGEAVLLPLVKDQEEAKAELEKVDCLIMTGGEDVDPAYYGEEPDENLEEVNKERDVSDMAMLQEAIDEDMPVLCTCRGLQVLNVLSGGSLVQDIPTSEEYKDSKIQHRDPAEEDFTYHDLTIEEDSLLAQIVGDTTLNANSWHHQGIKELGDNLKVTATSEDGMIEGIERTDCSYIVGVQFHPEWNVEEGDDSYLVFFTDLMGRTQK